MSGEMSLNWLNKVLRSNNQEVLSQADYASIYAELAEHDDDGIFTKTEFDDALANVLSAEQMSAIEDGYNEAYSALANYDGEEDFTLADLDEMGDDAANEAAQKFEAANADNNYANSEEYSQRENSKPVALQNQTAEIAAVSKSSLGSKNVETLRSERAQISTDIENERAAMEEAKAEKQEAVNTAEGNYNTALQNLSDAIGEIDENSSEAEQNFADLKTQRDDKLTQVNDQKNVINDLQSGVDSQKNAVSSISAQLSYHVGQEPQQASYKKEVTEDGETKEVDDTEAFETAHRAWEQQKAELEANKQEAEDKLSEYEQQLGEAENALKVLEQELQDLDGQVNDAAVKLTELKNENGESLSEIVDNAKTQLDTARNQLQEVTQPYEANIAQMQLNLAEYDAAITQAESSLNLEGQDGVEKKGVFENKALDAVNTSRDPETLSRNSASLSDEEQEEYLKEYLGDAYEGVELIASGDDTPGYFSRKNEDGTTDCFKVVNDQGKISLIHTNIPKDGTAMTEVYGVEALKDENGDPREYPKYLTTKDGALQPGQIESLAEDIMESGSIPENVDISTLSSQTLSSLIEKYGDGAKFANEIISTIDKDSQSDVLEKLDEIYNLRARRGYDNTDTQTNAARLALKELLNPEDATTSIDRMSLLEYGLDEGQNDSFANYAQTKGIDIETATVEELQSAVNDYNRLISQKNEFLEMYKTLENNPAFKEILEDSSRELTDSDYWSDGKVKQSLQDLYNWVNDVGSFRTSNESGSSAYDKDFEERVADAIFQMKDLVYDSGYSSEVENAIKEIEAKYEQNISSITVSEDNRVEKYADIGADNENGDTFKNYLETQGVDILSTQDSELEAYLQEYNDLIAQKEQFINLYNTFSKNPTLQGLLDDSFELRDTDNNNEKVKQTLQDLYNWVNNVGAFRTSGEDGTSGYDKDFSERVPDAIQQMIKYVEDNKDLFDEDFVNEILAIVEE